MARVVETLFRFAGALLLGASATAIDNPRVMGQDQLGRVATVPVVVVAKEIPEGTMLVPPVEAERLAIAAAQGALQLVLRGYGKPDSVAIEGTPVRYVRTDVSRSATVRVTRGPNTAQVRR